MTAPKVVPPSDGLRAPGLTKQALYWRLRRGWDLETAVTHPVRGGHVRRRKRRGR